MANASLSPRKRTAGQIPAAQMQRAMQALIVLNRENQHGTIGRHGSTDGYAGTPHAKREREIPLPDISETTATIRAQYALALAEAAGAIGLYLHGAASLPNPSLADVENLRDVIGMVRSFALDSVGFHSTK
jgi:hypothetical protein